MSRMLKNTGLFAEYRSLLQSSFAKETYIFKHPTNRRNPICTSDFIISNHVQISTACQHSYNPLYDNTFLLPSISHDISVAGHFSITHGVAPISRLLKIIRPFCRISSLLQGSLAKETYNLKEPTTCSHPIWGGYSGQDR